LAGVFSYTMYYYGYGSNMSTRYLRDYCPGAQFVMKAALPNFHVEFRRYSEGLRGGISTVMEAPGEMVHGVVFEVSDEEIAELDVLENVPEGVYIRETFLVHGEDGGWHGADLYRVVTPEGPFTPSRRYVGYMLEGMREHGIDREYVKKFEELLESLD
jgi:gamma-glutamylcyclotransferase (GGCT)/AIG2-like uncharacterized protein YtfP